MIDIVVFDADVIDFSVENSPKLLGRTELISFFKSLPENTLYCKCPGRIMLGLVGYPNVGTKSTMNALAQRELTSKYFIRTPEYYLFKVSAYDI